MGLLLVGCAHSYKSSSCSDLAKQVPEFVDLFGQWEETKLPADLNAFICLPENKSIVLAKARGPFEGTPYTPQSIIIAVPHGSEQFWFKGPSGPRIAQQVFFGTGALISNEAWIENFWDCPSNSTKLSNTQSMFFMDGTLQNYVACNYHKGYVARVNDAILLSQTDFDGDFGKDNELGKEAYEMILRSIHSTSN